MLEGYILLKTLFLLKKERNHILKMTEVAAYSVKMSKG